MNRAIKLVACLAWTGAALASATPANAILASPQQAGNYATCGTGYFALEQNLCSFQMHYEVNVRVHAIGCGAGGTCTQQNWNPADIIYSLGRKVTTHIGNCPGDFWYGYQLGACAC